MKLAGNPTIKKLAGIDCIVIPISDVQRASYIDFLSNIDKIYENEEYDVKIERQRSKRSLDANAYYWKLVQSLGEKLNIPYSIIYKEHIKDNGVFEIKQIPDEEVEEYIKKWEMKGTGYICDVMGSSKALPGFQNVRCFYGSSVYNTKQMARLIDAAIYDCHDQGIPTMPLDEIENLKRTWSDG